jgi:hypothetical protein
MTTPKEIYDAKRRNFVNKTKLHFEFLTSEFDFDFESLLSVLILDNFIGKNRFTDNGFSTETFTTDSSK